MSRIAKPPQSNLHRLRMSLRDYLEHVHTTPTALARACNLNQSTIQRFLAGDTKSVTPTIRSVLVYAKIDPDMRINREASAATDHPRIRRALEKVWDGQDGTAEILARLIEAVGPLIGQHAQASR